ncbi:MAG TPA: cold shock domain-containing protein [Stellaceae bacterium]|nr:cold shock domain-containing protein [Stellaceae bacterium]
MPPGETSRLTGTIKWFNRNKGFGFIIASDGGGDVFLPLAVLERSGFTQAPEGATVTFDCSQGAKGRAAVAVLNIDASTAQPSRQHPRDRGGESRGPGESLDGVVKWYDPARGFGFVVANDGGKDIFVHVTALRRSGIEMLTPGQAVRMTVSEAPRGREASSVKLI